MIYRDHWVDLGMVAATGFGPAVLSYAEVVAGMPWASARERRLMRDMSKAYLSGLAVGKDPYGIPPGKGVNDG